MKPKLINQKMLKALIKNKAYPKLSLDELKAFKERNKLSVRKLADMFKITENKMGAKLNGKATLMPRDLFRLQVFLSLEQSIEDRETLVSYISNTFYH